MARVLLIEDDESLAHILVQHLTDRGYEVTAAKDGEEGLAKWRSIHPDIVLLDIVLPKRSGFEVLEEVARDNVISRVPVVIISNSGQPVEIDRAKALGAVDYIIKAHIEPSEVLEKVRVNLPSSSSSKTAAMAHTLIVVEDDKFLRDLIVQKLRREGFEVLEAVSGDECLALAKENETQLILLDLILPGIDGFEVLKRLREDDETRDIPVLVLSNLGQQSDIEKASELGAVDYMIKAHFTPNEIITKIKGILNASEKRQGKGG